MGLVFSSPASADEPDEHHQHPETSIDRGENPRCGIIKQKLVQPVLNKSLCITRLTGPTPELVFPYCQRAELSEPGLQNDDPNRSQMCDSEFSIVDPRPPGQETEQNEKKAEYDEYYKCKMNDEYRIRQQAVQFRVIHPRRILLRGSMKSGSRFDT